jgi:hypothetical protein
MARRPRMPRAKPTASLQPPPISQTELATRIRDLLDARD